MLERSDTRRRGMGEWTRWVRVLPGIVVLVLAAACTSGDGGGGGATGSEAAGTSSATFTIGLTEFAIDPGVIHAPAGQTLTFQLDEVDLAPVLSHVADEIGRQYPDVEITREIPELLDGAADPVR